MGNFKEDMIKLTEYIGGKDNIVKVSHCISRLRIVLKDDTIPDTKAIENLDSVMGVFKVGGTFQVIIGTEVQKAYNDFIEVIGEDKKGSLSDVKVEGLQKQGIWVRFMQIFPGIFMPIIPAIASCGLLLGFKNLLGASGIFAADKSFVELFPQLADLFYYFGMFADIAFAYLPVLIGWSGAVYFKSSPVMGIVLGLLLVNTNLINGWDAVPGAIEYFNIFGIQIPKVGYQGSVLPMVASIYLMSRIEKLFDKVIPSVLKFVFVPMLTLLVTGTLAFIIVGPITRVIGNGLGSSMLFIHEKFPIIGGFLIGATMQPIVITGMHHTYTAINMQLYGSGVGSFMFPIEALSDWNHTIVTFMSIFVIKNAKMKRLAFSSAVTNAFGISEPAMFGVTLRLKWPFLASIISTGIWGAFVSFFQVKSPGGGLSSMLSFLSVYPVNIPIYLVAQIGSIITASMLVFLFNKIFKFGEKFE